MVKKSSHRLARLENRPVELRQRGHDVSRGQSGASFRPLQTTAGDTNLFQLVNSITESNAIGFDTEQLTIDAISLREAGEPGDNIDSASTTRRTAIFRS